MSELSELFQTHLDEHLAVARATQGLLVPLEQVAAVLCERLAAGGTLLICGNGGSAADAQHFAAELTGRYRAERRPLSAVALTTDSSALTCIGNDYAFEEVFARQVLALCRRGDVVVGLSTSGQSANVIRALEAGAGCGAVTLALSGAGGGALARLADHALVVPSTSTPRIQEMHVFLIHLLCERIDAWASR